MESEVTTMSKMYGEELRACIENDRERTLAVMRDRAERIAKGEVDLDDCFMSARSDSNSITNYEMQLGILDSDGLMDFDAVFDENGEEVWVHWVSTRYGTKLVGRGIFANSLNALLKKTGWHVKTIKVPVWTKFVSGGSGGMLGVYTGSYELVRWHTNMVTGEYVGYPN